MCEVVFTEEKRPKFICLYLDNEFIFQQLTNEQIGAVFRAAYAYAIRGEILNSDDNLVNMALAMISSQIDRDFKKYRNKCEKNKKNINKRWSDNDTTVYDRIQSNTNDTNRNTNSKIKSNTNINTNTNININTKEEQHKEEEKKEFPRGKEEETPNNVFISLPTTEGDFDITNAMYKEYQRRYPSNEVDMILHKLRVKCLVDKLSKSDTENLIIQRLQKGE